MPGITAPTESAVASADAISASAVSDRGIGFDGRALCGTIAEIA
jgi:hypothetical protein